MQYEYECQKCGEQQVKCHKMAEKNKEPCDECGAPPEQLKRVFLTPHPKHGTWGRWRV